MPGRHDEDFLKATAALILLTLAATSSEACGIATAQMARGRLDTRSYFDGQGDRSMDWPAGAVPEDGLPARALTPSPSSPRPGGWRAGRGGPGR